MCSKVMLNQDKYKIIYLIFRVFLPSPEEGAGCMEGGYYHYVNYVDEIIC